MFDSSQSEFLQFIHKGESRKESGEDIQPMSQIFISYSHEEKENANLIAENLQDLGWTVWWDPEIRAGEPFIKVIEEEINAAQCILVLWSRRSANSHWVREEAYNGLRRNILISVIIQKEVQIPIGFTTINHSPLINWDGDREQPQFKSVVRDIARLIGEPEKVAVKTEAKDQRIAGLRQPTEAIEVIEVVARSLEPEPIAIDRVGAPPDKQAEVSAEPPSKSEDISKTAKPELKAAPSLPKRPKVGGFVDLSNLKWIDIPALLGVWLVIAIIAADLCGRYLFARPLGQYAYELATAIFAGIAFYSLSVAERNDVQISIPFVALFWPNKAVRRFKPIVDIIKIAVYLVISILLIILSVKFSAESPHREWDYLVIIRWVGIAAFAVMITYTLLRLKSRSVRRLNQLQPH
jgi:TRAP-type C4-dicarboxylate transport system permease small subunit